MVIPMRHPVYGTKVAVAEQEAVNDEAAGWVRYTTLTVPAPLHVTVIESISIATTVSEHDALRQQYEAKFGTKPHHRMADATIAAALKDAE